MINLLKCLLPGCFQEENPFSDILASASPIAQSRRRNNHNNRCTLSPIPEDGFTKPISPPPAPPLDTVTPHPVANPNNITD